MSETQENNTVQGICTNKDCSYAQSKQVISSDRNNFVCPGCWKPLSSTRGSGLGVSMSGKKAGIIIGVIVLVGLLGTAGYFLFNMDPPLWSSTAKENPTALDSSATKMDSLAKATKSPPKQIAVQGVLKNIRDENKLVVGMEFEAPPMNYFDSDCRKGFDYELSKLLKTHLGVSDLLIREFSYDQLPEALLNGEIDLMMGGYVKDPEIEHVLWSDDYLEFGLCLITKQGSPYSHYGALANKRVAFYEGDPVARKWLVENIKDVELDSSSITGWLQMVEDGTVDAAIYDYPYAKEEVKDFPSLRIIEFNLNQSGYSIGIAEGNDDLLKEVNNFVTDISNEGQVSNTRYTQLVRQYLKADDASVKVSSKIGGLCQSPDCHTVKWGETLSSIALNKLGSKERWRDIYNYNKGRVPNPNLIVPGMELKMPK